MQDSGINHTSYITHRTKIALLALYMLLILTASVIPMDRGIEGLDFVTGLKPSIQNLLHVPAYGFLSILWLQILRPYPRLGYKRIFFVLFVSIGFGIFNELIQLTVPGRYPSVIDAGLNIIGVIGGMLLYLWLERSGPGPIRRIVCG